MKFLSSILNILIVSFPKIFWLLRPKYYAISHLNLKFYELLKKKLKNKKSNFLELGCSSGHLLSLIEKDNKYLSLTGCDISLLNILICKLKFFNNSKINIYHKDFTKLNFSKYDIIISQATLVYLSEKQIKQFFYKIFTHSYPKCYFLELGINSDFEKKNKLKYHFHLHDFKRIINELKKKKYIKKSSIRKLDNLNWHKNNKNISPYFIELN